MENGRLHSTLSYKKGESAWIDVSAFDFDTQKASYKKSMNFTIERLANRLKNKYDVSTISRIADILEGLPEALYDKLGREEYIEETSLSVFYHLAMFNTARRAYENKSDCHCGVNESYKNDESPFICAEDIFISADRVYDFIKKQLEIKKAEGYQFNPESLFSYLKSESGHIVSASKIDKLLRDELNSFWKKLTVKERERIYNEYEVSSKSAPLTKSDNSENYNGWPIDLTCWLYNARSGRDCGCCGNYEGPCILCSILCWEHDLLCVNCLEGTGWETVCFSGCQPGCPNYE